MGNYDRPVQDYDQALRINPNQVEAFDSRGLAYAHKGGVDHAIQDYNQALRINPNYGNAFIARENAYRQKRDYGRSIQDSIRRRVWIPTLPMRSTTGARHTSTRAAMTGRSWTLIRP